MRALLSAEVIKLTKRKMPWVLGGILVFLTALGAFLQYAAADLFDSADLEVLAVPDKPEAYLYGFLNAAGNTWVPVILAVVMLGYEFSKGTWGISLTWDASRSRHLMAKLAVLTGGATVLALLGVVVWMGFSAAMAEGAGFVSVAELVLATGELVFVQATWVAVGLAAVALIRSTGLAVGLAVGLTFVEQLLALWPAYQDYSIGGATSGIFDLQLPVVVGNPLVLPDPGRSAMILLIWGVVSLGVAWAAVTYRDA